MSSRPKIKRDRVKEPSSSSPTVSNGVASSSKTTLDTPSKTASRRKREKANGEDKGVELPAGVDFISIVDSDDDGKEKRRSKRRHSEDDTDRTSSKRSRRKERRKGA